jgi:hypothetical protein
MIPPENKENFTYAIEIRQLTIVSEIEIFSMRLIKTGQYLGLGKGYYGLLGALKRVVQICLSKSALFTSFISWSLRSCK